MSDRSASIDTQSVKPPIASFFARHWWLFLLPACLAAYLFVVSLLVETGQRSDLLSGVPAADTGSVSNTYFESALSIAPWHTSAKVKYATWLRTYAVSGLVSEQNLNQEVILERVLGLYTSAMQDRPMWPYYHLGAFDAEYLLNKPESVIQERFDSITALAPNERGLDRNLIELSLYSWSKLRADQKAWIVQRLKSTQHRIRKDMLALIGDLKAYNPDLCVQMPWNLVRRACRE